MQEIVEFVAKCGHYFLATVDGDAPRLRPLGTLAVINGKLSFQTANTKAVSRQLEVNPNVAICAYDGETWVRVTGQVFAQHSVEANQLMLDIYPSLKSMYSADDGKTEVYAFTSGTAVFSTFGGGDRTVEF
ncbi:MAG: pyridoxamine 5'-phosphate oxidase family protein [Propionibacteriaceae bacterium]|jgi:uncharacterized pyridoxamine 5'-phosphate oxidase family protein|nr:pyridoxamine 5'-phosphate oxidase family protein [Propionibacteriaceae bacterium]